MKWNWELADWPKFTYDSCRIVQIEKRFLLQVGQSLAFFKNLNLQEQDQFVVEILSLEGLESAKIEGEILDRESLQSSIKKHFGLNTTQKQKVKEQNMSKLLCDVYQSFDQPLTHDMLFKWHRWLFDHQTHLNDIGIYRTHSEPMQIISTQYDSRKVYFEAPPSPQVMAEMTKFIDWFNKNRGSGSILGRAAIAHAYFESIHPFEDGNGRIGRLLVEKILSEEIGKPLLISLSLILEKRKKEYYAALESCNCTLKVDHWVDFFSNAIMQAQEKSIHLLYFLMEKAKMFTNLSLQLNSRQEKMLLRMFADGPEGFKGGLSAENYMTITKTSRATATRDLANLVEKNALKKSGELRYTRYWLNLSQDFYETE